MTLMTEVALLVQKALFEVVVVVVVLTPVGVVTGTAKGVEVTGVGVVLTAGEGVGKGTTTPWGVTAPRSNTRI